VPRLQRPCRSPSFASETARIDQRYLLKTLIGVALGALVLGVALLLAALYRRERKYLEGQSRFVATVSHELRTPLASLRLMGETLERRFKGEEAARDFPSRIVKEADRLSFLVENILSFNRLEKASVTTHRQQLPVEELIASCHDDMAVFTSKPVDISLTRGADVGVDVDPDLTKLLISNLLHNACKYHGRDRVRISVEASAEPERVVLCFSDNGVGIDPSEWDSIFTQFVRARSAGRERGFGLGLALCRRIMQLHEGSIRVSQSSDAGTTFELVWPKIYPST
jgi:signal transduction histidine kinase